MDKKLEMVQKIADVADELLRTSAPGTREHALLDLIESAALDWVNLHCEGRHTNYALKNALKMLEELSE